MGLVLIFFSVGMGWSCFVFQSLWVVHVLVLVGTHLGLADKTKVLITTLLEASIHKLLGKILHVFVYRHIASTTPLNILYKLHY